ncbi:MAG: DUF4348 domain-containing protein [Prevotella sp.]|uniref:DUF4348 domain-containing protein n=1 Tax=Prevotella sp. TaxID=59823 RepID=UPI002A2BC5BC|nr:DUF4348 domain-containing protein [Prevotella sp.]MDD7318696.1 DUF4348 domain-containing protein [Prevotellaceae bacterium]MDY4019339.1 DUF4348 domain-containing protein [Prevotella sp.]
MKKAFVLVIAVLLCSIMTMQTTSCTDKKTGQDSIVSDSLDSDTTALDSLEKIMEETPMPKTADELFDDFVFNFAGNSKLQRTRIVFPLPVVTGKKTSMIQNNQWRTEHFFMAQGYYTLIFDNRRQMALGKDTSVNHVVVEKIMLNRKAVKQYVFNRTDGKWMLTGIVNQGLSQNHNASFLNFYDKFANDTAYQIASLNNPVKFTGPDPDDDFASMTGEIAPETWLAFAPTDMPRGTIYNIMYGEKPAGGNEKIFCLRGIANGQEMEMTFKKIGGKWKLTKLVQ